TLVLTNSGWKPIIEISIRDRVWDGENWVDHLGVVYQGQKETILLNGIRVTPEHPVLTTKGWVDASQSEGYNRAESRLPYGDSVRWERWSEIPVVSSLRLGSRDLLGCESTAKEQETRSEGVMRLQEGGNCI